MNRSKLPEFGCKLRLLLFRIEDAIAIESDGKDGNGAYLQRVADDMVEVIRDERYLEGIRAHSRSNELLSKAVLPE